MVELAVPGRTRYESRNAFAFAALRCDGSVVTWGDRFSGFELVLFGCVRCPCQAPLLMASPLSLGIAMCSCYFYLAMG